MIVFGKTKEIKTASATSTYPAVITCVGNKSSDGAALINLSFYCPSTMDGHPMECAYCGSNIVEAPTSPHNGAEDYDYQVGGVICISYEDGNLNTPQFVRYVKVSSDTINYNKKIIEGSYIPADESQNINYMNYNLDILKSPRLQKALTLLPAVKKSASGNDNDFYYSFILGRNYPFEQDRAYVKAGLYGAEFLCTDFPDFKTSNWWDFTAYTSELKYKQKTLHRFIDICSYLVTDSSGVSTVKPEKIVDDVFRRSSITDVKYINAKSHPLATYLFVVLCGLPRALDDFENQAQKLYANAKPEAYNKNIIDESTDKTKKISKLKSSLMDFYTLPEEQVLSYKSVWDRFISVYGDELKKCYVCILNDNLVALSMMYSSYMDGWDNVMFAIMAVVATAWPMLEMSITESSQYVDEDDNSNKFFKTVSNYLIDNKPASEFNDKTINYISNGYADAYIYLMTKDWNKSSKELPSDFKSTIVKNMTLGIKEIVNNWDTIGKTLAKTYNSDSSTDSGEVVEGVVPSGGDSNSYHIWCVLMGSIGNAYGVAGIMGNLVQESGLESNKLQYGIISGMTSKSYTAAVNNKSYSKNKFMYDSAGYGLAQWTWPTRKENLYNRTVKNGKSISDVDLQLEFLLDELKNNYKSTYEVLKTAKSVEAAVDYFMIHFENPDLEYAHRNKRVESGEHYYKLYANYNPSAATGGWGSGNLICPLNKGAYYISCEYGGYAGHSGIDLAVPKGTKVYASGSGTITLIKDCIDSAGKYYSYGKYIKINHGNGVESFYCHLSNNSILKQGTKVTQGQLIAESGNTGNSSGPHLHFEIRKNNTAVNPRNYVKF